MLVRVPYWTGTLPLELPPSLFSEKDLKKKIIGDLYTNGQVFFVILLSVINLYLLP